MTLGSAFNEVRDAKRALPPILNVKGPWELPYTPITDEQVADYRKATAGKTGYWDYAEADFNYKKDLRRKRSATLSNAVSSVDHLFDKLPIMRSKFFGGPLQKLNAKKNKYINEPVETFNGFYDDVEDVVGTIFDEVHAFNS